MSSSPSCTSNFRPKYSGSSVPGLSPSSNRLWSTHTLVAPEISTWSYSEFQLPLSPSVGSHPGKQSWVSEKVRLRRMTLSTRSEERRVGKEPAPDRVARIRKHEEGDACGGARRQE